MTVIYGSRLKALFVITAGVVWAALPLTLAYGDPAFLKTIAFNINGLFSVILILSGIYLIFLPPKLVIDAAGFTITWTGLYKQTLLWAEVKEWRINRVAGALSIGWNLVDRTTPVGAWSRFRKSVTGMDGGLPGILAASVEHLAADFDVFAPEKRLTNVSGTSKTRLADDQSR